MTVVVIFISSYLFCLFRQHSNQNAFRLEANTWLITLNYGVRQPLQTGDQNVHLFLRTSRR